MSTVEDNDNKKCFVVVFNFVRRSKYASTTMLSYYNEV